MSSTCSQNASHSSLLQGRGGRGRCNLFSFLVVHAFCRSFLARRLDRGLGPCGRGIDPHSLRIHRIPHVRGLIGGVQFPSPTLHLFHQDPDDHTYPITYPCQHNQLSSCQCHWSSPFIRSRSTRTNELSMISLSRRSTYSSRGSSSSASSSNSTQVASRSAR